MRHLLASIVLFILALAACSAKVHQAGGGGGGAPDAGIMPPLPDAGPSCIPQCATATCGADGCGGTCGACDPSQLCSAGACIAVTGAAFQVDVASNPHAIHDEVYGLAFADEATLTGTGATVNRWGGNGVTLYNWQLDTGNTASDWYFENIANNAGDPTYGTAAYKSQADQFVETNRAAHAATVITIPTIGFTAKDRPTAHPYTCGFPVSVYGAQQSTDPYDSNCGNGKDTAGNPLTPNAANDATAVAPSFEAAWLAHLVSTFGAASAGGVKYYTLDNEMMLWNSTHRDVHPAAVTYDEVWKATTEIAPLVKTADPSAFVLGYGTWGVLDLFDSGLDSTNNLSDQKAHGNVPLAPWYLQQLAAYQAAHGGARLVDCLDIHYYPQGGDPLQNTASLWDATYHDPSWIDDWLGEPIQLLPRVAKWIADNNPGTGTCITEYNFNLNDQDNPIAALAEADVLGIFGKYGVRLATYWTTFAASGGAKHAGWYGMQIYRNFDGAGGTFGDVSVGAASTIPGVAVYAATSTATGSLTVLFVNKTTSAQSGALSLASFSAGAAAKTYQFTAGGSAITKGADLAISGNRAQVSLPASSLLLLVIAKA